VALEGSPARAAIRVLALVPGSPAEALGIKAGDLLTRLDDEEFLLDPAAALQSFRDKVRAHGPGDKVKLHVVRDAVTVSAHVGGAPHSEGTGSGVSWGELLPDLRKLVEENPGKLVTVSAEKARWERDVIVTLGERPGTRATPLPDNPTLRPDLEAMPLEPEAALAKELVARAGVQASFVDVSHRLDEDEKIEDAFRLKTVRYLKRDPLRLPGATKALARSLAPAARSADLAAVISASGLLLDVSLAPILTTQAPEAPPRGSGVQAHVDYCLALMRRARELGRIALASLSSDEQDLLAKNLPELWERFKETIILYDDEDQARWKRESTAIDLLAKVDRGAYLQALRELEPLARPAYLDQLALDLKDAEGTGRGFFYEIPDGYVGTVLYEAQTDLGHVVVGGSGSNGYRGDEALVIDLAGDDRYYRRVGSGHGPALPVGVAIDLAGDDIYTATEPFAQGTALLGVGLLVDRKGDDHYTSLAPFAQGACLAGAAALVDQDGADVYRADSYAHGAALAQGLALLLDRAGRDSYECGIYGQGFAGPGGAGLLLDASGDDHYVCLGRKKCSYGEDGVFDAHGQGSSCGFRGKGSGGLALLLDVAGDDAYEAGNFSQGCGYYFGWGVICDMGAGKDRYDGSRYAQAAAAHSALGSLWDEGGDDRYTAAVAAAQGVAWDLCAVAFMDESGHDSYDGGSNLSQGASAHNGLAIFYDAQGEDRYALHRRPPAHAGPNDYHGGQSLSFFIEGGGEKNHYDVAETNVAFVPSQGFTVTGERSIFLDLPYRIEKLDRARLDALYPGR
ncbi:MAG: PDZ domain-containing protein, partial [Planctomycetota bacterium]